jgi:hypothetical protein
VLPDALARLLSVEHVVPHTDADALAAGAIALRARGEGAEKAVLLARGQTPFGADAPLPQGSVAVLDWGVRTLARPGLIVDHHAPETEPRPDQLVVSGYGEQPQVTTSVLMRRMFRMRRLGSPRSARSGTSAARQAPRRPHASSFPS